MATPNNQESVVEQDVVETNEKVETTKQTEKVEKQKKPKKVKKVREHKVGKVKETVSELKKVSWPSFSKIVKQTLVVLGMVLFFTVVLFAIDKLLQLAYDPFVEWINRLNNVG